MWLNPPPPPDLTGALRPQAAGVAVVAAGRADYHLVGRCADGRVEYAWARPWGGAPPSGTARALPARTDWHDAANPAGAAGGLAEQARRLATIHRWLTVDGPPDDGAFPYHLAIFDADASDPRRAYKVSGTLQEGRRYNLALVATAALGRRQVEPRWVYVFVLDKEGRSTLLVPSPGRGDVENRFPPPGDEAARPVYKLLREDLAWVGPPFGADTYVLLTTTEKLPDPHALESEAVRTRGVAGGALPAGGGWSVRRVVVESVGR